jgi:hypothetical protein
VLQVSPLVPPGITALYSALHSVRTSLPQSTYGTATGCVFKRIARYLSVSEFTRISASSFYPFAVQQQKRKSPLIVCFTTPSLCLILQHYLSLYAYSVEWYDYLHGTEPFLRSRQLCSYSIDFQHVKEARRFITVFTRALRWSLSSVRRILSTPPQPISLAYQPKFLFASSRARCPPISTTLT